MRKIDVKIRNDKERIIKELTRDEIDALPRPPAPHVRVFEMQAVNPETKQPEIRLVKQKDLWEICTVCAGSGKYIDEADKEKDCPHCDAEVRGYNHYKSFYEALGNQK